ncbi:hypothetical protein EZV62_004336 [Acer yangbiense]|uniref:Uncharacterized protein n=1 Tax=Acer yangbiense TaxID=1000413 RepID=A0A5C7IJN9_9ROSI|nr:hypothetical protein EZV62_004336 [Acer yangbiense]
MLNNANLESLKIEGCHSVQFIVRGLLPSSLKRLEIKNCQDLECLLDDREEGSTSSSVLHSASLLEYLYVSDCPSLTSLSSSGQLPEKLRTLIVTYNSKLESIAESIVCFPPGGFPLTDLSVEIVRCKELRALPSSFHNLTSLQELDIWKCPSISSFPEEGFPTNLTRLLIKDNLRIYKSLARWGLHKFTSLTSLIIGGCPDAESFPQEEIGMILPHSLVHLNIQDFKNLKYLCSQGFRNLTSLEQTTALGTEQGLRACLLLWQPLMPQIVPESMFSLDQLELNSVFISSYDRYIECPSKLFVESQQCNTFPTNSAKICLRGSSKVSLAKWHYLTDTSS